MMQAEFPTLLETMGRLRRRSGGSGSEEVIIPGLNKKSLPRTRSPSQNKKADNLSFMSHTSSMSTTAGDDDSEEDSGCTTPPSCERATRWCDVEECITSDVYTLVLTPRPAESNLLLPKAFSEASYPSDLCVRNTFLDFAREDAAVASVASHRRRARSHEPIRHMKNFEIGEETSIVNVGVGAVNSNVMFKPLSETVRDLPPLGSSSCPSLGSSAHVVGACRPCAFFWKSAGCTNGKKCEFCHLCDPLEKKRRHKAKKSMLKAQAAAELAEEQEELALLVALLPTGPVAF